MTDVHLTQFTGSRCAPYNCAAASDGMAINFAGGPLLTADQVRSESGVSCVPGVDTVSGGLRISDVKRVAAANGVTLDYGTKPDGTHTSWPRDELQRRLVAGQGAILLGDCQDAPVNPTAGVVLHSAFVHDLRSDGRTHWHDPRLGTAYWITLEDVIRYWESFANGQRYAGFVAPDQAGSPPDTSTGDDMGPTLIEGRPIGSAYIPAGAKFIPLDGKPEGVFPTERRQEFVGEGYYAPLNVRGIVVGTGDSEWALVPTGYSDLVWYDLRPNPTPPPTANEITLGPGLYRVP